MKKHTSWQIEQLVFEKDSCQMSNQFLSVNRFNKTKELSLSCVSFQVEAGVERRFFSICIKKLKITAIITATMWHANVIFSVFSFDHRH